MSAPTRVGELLDVPGYRTLLAALRERLESTGRPATVTLRNLDPDAARALADLLVLPTTPGPHPRVRVDAVDRALRESRVGMGLTEVLEAWGGPLADHRHARAARREAWDAVWRTAHAHEAGGRQEVRRWLEALRADGVAARLAGEPEAAQALLADALEIVGRLPARKIPLARLAAETTGDPHALDPGRPLTTLALRAAAELVGLAGVPSGARGRRRLWAQVGVVCDAVSVSVLTLGLRLAGDGLLTRTTEMFAEMGEPTRLTLRALEQHEVVPVRGPVYVCENPSVVASAADVLGGRCRPLVCVDGIPDTAADTLLHAMRAAGCEVRFHADFDWGGVRVGNLLVERYDARPWRFSGADYTEALERAGASAALGPATMEAAWDPALAGLMRSCGRSVPEEHVIDTLLTDLTT